MKCTNCGKKIVYKEFYDEDNLVLVDRDIKDIATMNVVKTNNSGGKTTYVKAKLLHNARKKLIKNTVFNPNSFVMREFHIAPEIEEYCLSDIEPSYSKCDGIEKCNVVEILCPCKEGIVTHETDVEKNLLLNYTHSIFNKLFNNI